MAMQRVQKYSFFPLIVGIWILVSIAWISMYPLRTVEAQTVRPNIMIIFDTSGSMQWGVNGNTLNIADSQGRKYGSHEDSRLAIAKSVVTDVLNETKTLANYGLMTFLQTHYNLTSPSKGYFPYYKAYNGTTVTKTMYFSMQDLNVSRYIVGGVPNQKACSGYPCYEPVNSFEYNGVTYTLRSANNSRYQRDVGESGRKDVDHDYCSPCGYECMFTDPDDGIAYTWRYQGSYYAYEEMPVANYTFYHFKKYYGRQFKALGTEDLDGGCNRLVDPNDVFVYYSGRNNIDFYYPNVAPWDPTLWGYNYPVGAIGPYDTNRGGVVLVPFSFSSDQDDQDAKVNDILQWMGPQTAGGLIATGYTPTGSTLSNYTTASGYYNDFREYFLAEVDPNDPLESRRNYILFITDGEPTPSSEGTLAISNAENLYKDYNITVYMVGFGSDTAGSAILDYIAQAGGCPIKSDGHFAYYANNAEELRASLRKIIYEASEDEAL